MKIVMIHGQNHKGNTYYIANKIVENINIEKDVTEFFLPRDLNHFCTGCFSCVKDESKCPFYTEKRKILDEVEQADLLIFTTPTYCMRASAPMKSFLDFTFTYWMIHKPRKCMFNKRAVVVSSAAGSGAKSAIKDITTSLFYWGIPCIKTYGISVSAMNVEQIPEKIKAKIQRDTEKIARSIVKKSKVRVGIKTKVIFTFMRLMQKGNMGASVEEKKYWEDNGWLGKERPWRRGK